MRPVLLITGLLAVFLFSGTGFAQAPVGEVFTADSTMQGTVLYAGSGTTVLSGSQVAAGGRAALLKLSRGGDVRICPSTSIGVASSPNGRNLLFSLNEGEIEFHFDVRSDGDVVQTPDFRIQFIGPGRFDLSMCTDKHGNLALRGNNNRAAIIVSEMMGDGIYQVSAGDSIDFHAGTVANPQKSTLPCGCPEPSINTPPIVVAQSAPPTTPTPPAPAPTVPVAQQSAPPATAPTPHTSETHVQVDAPFVFSGSDLSPEIVGVLAHMQTISVFDLASRLQPTVTMPIPPQNSASLLKSKPESQKKHGFFHKLGSFFGKIFKG
jgi:hypothetical protein